MTGDTATSVEQPLVRLTRHKALLVGITYRTCPDDEYKKLRGPAADAHDMRSLLIELFHYAEEDIVMMTDEEHNKGTKFWPTSHNIRNAIDDFVEGARAGDCFVFLYSGHGEQSKALLDKLEVDELDECLVGCDEERILDDDLRSLLVNRLPYGTRLTAIFDACHSETLLDLGHYRCNRIVQRRKSVSITPSPHFLDACFIKSGFGTCQAPLQPRKPMKSHTLDVKMSSLSPIVARIRRRVMNLAWASAHLIHMAKNKTRLPCSGHGLTMAFNPTPTVCRPGQCELARRVHYGPSVISLSAVPDYQLNWEGGTRGSAMTNLLVQILKKKPFIEVGALGETLHTQLFARAFSRCREFLKWGRDHELTAEQEKILRAQIRALRCDEMPLVCSVVKYLPVYSTDRAHIRGLARF
ncbi:hypothetical protein BV25DRAFT_1818291 [Artomyces pyxidatus]|uniref:Uncharacterized protein n=1 Tax=Artomyces pyxidatus TaxID=48021 RepID=A0ACB8TLL2_9AGAM|nr:hypothetical protein BV25DRAFT_1818291 [Artomyces pyxidatus]